MSEETLFHEALAKPAAERAAFLEQACAGQPQLRAAVEALLAAHDASGSLFDRPPVELAHTVDPEPAPPEPGPTPLGPTTDHRPQVEPGVVIAGRYTLAQKIGEGGMGEVWVAKQTEPVKRKVALKLIKTGMDSKAVLARFEQERQALAMMDHPNIARVLDGGLTPDGRPFFVMELVNGLPLTKFCDEARLTTKERLELFVPICQAVQHAHHKGIVHRDLKPANILVTLIDGRGVPKVIDFGVAKATAGKLTDESLSTQFGAVVGTLEYMSPEQAGFSGIDIDTRADVYSLGVILYELLTGLRPIDAGRLKRAALSEMIRIIQEEEPARPSTRLSADESLPSLAALRQTEPRQLMALLRGELDWVVMKCLEKRRDRRYETANGLARDIQRYLADEAVEARPPSAGYRLGKFLKRNKGRVLAAGLVLLALLAGMVGTTVGLIQADLARAAEAKRVTERDAALVKAKQEAENARLSEAEALAARNDLGKANTALQESSDRLLTGVARSLLRPLDLQIQANQPLPPLNEQEIEPLWDLASSPEERLHLRFVEEALRDPVVLRRLKDRSAFALQAAVGLNPTRRTQVEALLVRGLQAKEVSPEQREDVAICLAHLGIRDRSLAEGTAATLTQAMSKTTDLSALQSLAQGLEAVASRLEPKEAAEAAAALTQALSKTTDPNAISSLAQGLSAMASRLEPKEAAEAAAALIEAMSRTTDPTNGTLSLAQDLSAVAKRLDPKEAAEAAAALTQALSKTTDPNAISSLADGLSAVAARLEPKDASRACGQAVTALTQAISKTTDDLFGTGNLAQSLSAVAARLDPKEAAEAAAALIQDLSKTTDPNAISYLAQSLSAVAARLDPKEAAQAYGQAAAALIQDLSKTTDPNAISYLAQSLSAVAARLDPKEAAEAAAALIQDLSKTTDPIARRSLAQSLSAVAARLDPKEAAQVYGQAAAALIQDLSMTINPNTNSLAKSLSAVLSPQESAATQKQLPGVTATVAAFGGPVPPLAALASAQLAMEPLPPPLPPQTLVDLLKHPLCVGETRRLVLEQLGRRYNRRFADSWEFVDYVRQNKLDLDLTTPPERPSEWRTPGSP